MSVIFQLTLTVIRAFLKRVYHVFSMCMCLECHSPSYPLKRGRISFY